MNLFERETLMKQLEIIQTWDVIVIGGGATGLGIALDSVTRGFKTLLLEQYDFAKGTSSKSTKLAHGGVRYLAQGDISLVREALFERGLMLRNAPHIVKNQSFIIPNYRRWDEIQYTVGLKAYDFLAGNLSLGKSQRINPKETYSRLNTVKKENLKGGVLYYDGQFDDSRLAVNIAQTCIEKGATVLNHFKVKALTKENGMVSGVTAIDTETDNSFTFSSKTIINATGVLTDDILTMDIQNAKKTVRPSQGVHLVIDKSFLPGNDAIMIPKTSDGRVLFLVPWHNKVVLGTTDTLLEKASIEPIALEQEVDFILATANLYLTKKVTRKDVRSIYAGLRPLAAPKDGSEKTKEISRSHKVIVSESGLISVIGGKWTTYRRMAQDTIDKAMKLGKLPHIKCKTKELKIHGACNHVDRSHPLHIYGSDRENIESLILVSPELRQRIHPNLQYTRAEVVWAIRNEMARTVEDILARRVRILFLDARAAIEAAPTVAKILAKELNKSDEWKQKEIVDFNMVAMHYVL
ncbi:MAG TPA: FAD-dependent oxidoreductase [Maribacter sp.]|uniref:glycerol-3-phosphate dehydrogenase/oxidase n=1 Tax=Maribacter TaxID=252356 RepID=UPI000C4E2E51|nr:MULTISPECIES: glycerol-3-phosphate dehydrogenase/oxidase [unclassified Maribacter]MBC71727.1 FAD-dependent oxidoreductase [Allomuricauda sp.]HAF78068.1 FAD-dependent oxidoreductase [Maribacter sp.]|tara:strand:- start:6765 stop:8330 length:1566 start_codon:yes stop_codon:yes gene_type:complete